MNSTMESKIFCIGYHKTGTTSLGSALKKLGYRVCGCLNRYLKEVEESKFEEEIYTLVFDMVNQYDAFQDNPWPILYKELDEKYPNSKFIFTIRDSDSWIKSQVKNFGYFETQMRKWIYGIGCPKGNEKIYIKKYNDHHKDVVNYFKNRPDDLLILDLTKGDGWNKLCTFLKKDIPNIPFPHANKTRFKKISRLWVFFFGKKSLIRLRKLIKLIRRNHK